MTLLTGVGDILARQLLQYFGDAESVFTAKPQLLEKVPGIGSLKAESIVNSRKEALEYAAREVAFIDKNKIRMFTIADEDYPYRLRECPDAPVVFYFTGDVDLNSKRIISIVGTREATDYGAKMTSMIVKELSESFDDLLIISGLAYGIDICAHRSALKCGLKTVGVLAHGLDRIYPAAHRKTAVAMVKSGGLLTDFPSGTTPDRENFLKRNRLIAGLADATIIAESATTGGALVTADIAFSYSREVFTFPGRIGDQYSEGCNRLIQMNKAGLITSGADLIKALNWDLDKTKPTPQQSRIMFERERPHSPALDAIVEKGQIHIDELSALLGIPVYRLSPELFDLELNGYIKTFPGGIYKPNF